MNLTTDASSCRYHFSGTCHTETRKTLPQWEEVKRFCERRGTSHFILFCPQTTAHCTSKKHQNCCSVSHDIRSHSEPNAPVQGPTRPCWRGVVPREPHEQVCLDPIKLNEIRLSKMSPSCRGELLPSHSTGLQTLLRPTRGEGGAAILFWYLTWLSLDRKLFENAAFSSYSFRNEWFSLFFSRVRREMNPQTIKTHAKTCKCRKCQDTRKKRQINQNGCKDRWKFSLP